jgi:hypothetical protein
MVCKIWSCIIHKFLTFCLILVCSDISTLVESLLAKRMVPVDLGLKDLYIKLLPDGTPKLQVLVTDGNNDTF